MSIAIAGARVLLTGATGGIGTALATEFARRGARLVLTGRKIGALKRLAESLPGEHETRIADLSDPPQAARLARAAGQIDILIANAGVVAADRLEDLTSDEITAQISVNLTSTAVLTAELGSGMLARAHGHVVLISSIAGRMATITNGPLYTASKWGLRGLGLQLREDWRETGVGVSVIYPGPVSEAGMFARTHTTLPPGLRAVSPHEVARATAEAIQRDRAEITVADFTSRSLCQISGFAPHLVAATVRRAPTPTAARAIQVRQSRETPP